MLSSNPYSSLRSSQIEHKEALAAVGWSSFDWHSGNKEDQAGKDKIRSGGALLKLLKKTNHVVATPPTKAQANIIAAPIAPPVDMAALRKKKLESLVDESFKQRTFSHPVAQHPPKLKRATSMPLENQEAPETLKRAAKIWKRKSSTYSVRHDDGALQRAAKEFATYKATPRQRRSSMSIFPSSPSSSPSSPLRQKPQPFDNTKRRFTTYHPKMDGGSLADFAKSAANHKPATTGGKKSVKIKDPRVDAVRTNLLSKFDPPGRPAEEEKEHLRQTKRKRAASFG